MGHLLFLVLFAFGFILLFSRIYIDYRLAARNKQETNVGLNVSVQPHKFIARKPFGIFYLLLVPMYLGLVYYICRHLHQQDSSNSRVIFWCLVDSIIPVSFVFLAASLKSFRSYINIFHKGFNYCQLFKTKTYSQEDIECVTRTNSFIFVKLKSRKTPVIIENGYNNYDRLYGMLSQLAYAKID